MQTEEKIVARPRATFAKSDSRSTANARAQFDAARRGRVEFAPSATPDRIVIAMKDSGPSFGLIVGATLEAIFVEPIRSLRRKFRGRRAA